MLKKLTPILTVDAIEPCVSFWTKLLGFEVLAEVPEGDSLGFVLMERDGIEVMYQSKASLAKDLPGIKTGDGAMIYLEVDDIQAIVKVMPAESVVVPLRKTFYGSTELWVREPGGYIVGFAQQGTAE